MSRPGAKTPDLERSLKTDDVYRVLVIASRECGARYPDSVVNENSTQLCKDLNDLAIAQIYLVVEPIIIHE